MSEQTIGPLKVSIWRPTTAGKHPLVLFSHGFHGSSTQSTFLTKALAEHGYLVIAPDHKDSSKVSNERLGAGLLEFALADTWTEASHRDRQTDFATLIATLKKEAAWNSEIDWDKVAVVGHSLGGYTALGLAGAWSSWRLPEVKAVIALSPYCEPYIRQNLLKNVAVPVLYQGGTQDIPVTTSVERPDGAFDQTKSPAWFVNFDGANHFAWTDWVAKYQPSIDFYCLAFLDHVFAQKPKGALLEKRSDVASVKEKAG